MSVYIFDFDGTLVDSMPTFGKEDKTARTAGAYVIGVYDESSAEYEDEMRLICNAYIRDFSELI